MQDYRKRLEHQLAIDYCCTDEEMQTRQNQFHIYRPLEGRRRFRTDDDCFLKVISYRNRLLFAGHTEILDWCRKQYAQTEAAWFMEPDNMRVLDRKLGEYGYGIGFLHPFYVSFERAVFGGKCNAILCDRMDDADEYGGTGNAAACDEAGACIGRMSLTDSRGDADSTADLSALNAGFGEARVLHAGGLEFRCFRGAEIEAFRGDARFMNANSFCETAPDMIDVAAYRDGRILGMAGVSADSPDLWQIGIDVLPKSRGLGLGVLLVKLLKNEVHSAGRIPFYGTAVSHMLSQDIAIRAGFRAGWAELTSRPRT